MVKNISDLAKVIKTNTKQIVDQIEIPKNLINNLNVGLNQFEN